MLELFQDAVRPHISHDEQIRILRLVLGLIERSQFGRCDLTIRGLAANRLCSIAVVRSVEDARVRRLAEFWCAVSRLQDRGYALLAQTLDLGLRKART